MRAAGIPSALKMKILIVFAAVVNLVDGVFYFLTMTYLLSLADWQVIRMSLILNNVSSLVAIFTLPLLYFGRYDAILHSKTILKNILKGCWVLPILGRLISSIQYCIPAAAADSWATFTQTVIYTNVGLSANAFYTISEAALVITSDLIVLLEMRTIATRLNRPFWGTIGISRWIRIVLMFGLSFTASIYPFVYAGNRNVEGYTAFIENLSIGYSLSNASYSFSVLLDFYEIDMGVFRESSHSTTRASKLPTGPSSSIPSKSSAL